MYTTKEAAQRLGISMRRVNALVASGDLEAQRFGRSWMLDERSVHERAERGRTAGRPKMNEKNERNLAPFTLMNRNHPVLDFVYNRRTRETADIVPRDHGRAGAWALLVGGPSVSPLSFSAAGARGGPVVVRFVLTRRVPR